MNAPEANEYKCDVCDWIYLPVQFNGVDLSEQPDGFVCPECQSTADHFQILVPVDDLAEPTADDLDSESEETHVDDTASAANPKDSLGELRTRKIYTDTGDPSIATLKSLRDDKDLDTQPEFQRYEVWTPTKKSRLIESILLGLPIPRIYLAENEDETQVVIDGQQRLQAAFRYMDGDYALSKLNVLESLNSKRYGDLDPKIRKRIKNFKLSTVLIQKESDPGLRFDMFERLNTGAIGLNDQELRNCVNRGPYNDFIYELADLPDWRKLLKLPGRHKRMADAELVLRFMAFRDQTYLHFPQTKSTKDFLNDQMSLGRLYDKAKFDKARSAFKRATALTISVFGDRAFRKLSIDEKGAGSWERRRVLALADVQLWGFTQYKKGEVMGAADAIYEAALDLMADPKFDDLITNNTSDSHRVAGRFEMWKKVLDDVLADADQGPRVFPLSLKKQLFEQDPTCNICKQQIKLLDDAHLDHVHPYAEGGKTVIENAALTHRYCNWKKQANAIA